MGLTDQTSVSDGGVKVYPSRTPRREGDERRHSVPSPRPAAYVRLGITPIAPPPPTPDWSLLVLTSMHRNSHVPAIPPGGVTVPLCSFLFALQDSILPSLLSEPAPDH